ncbi:MAG: hypothetical protein ICV62_03160 [Cyanobacteria bacterium Co-bin13]|nr:hypothetical protein [Cyanobacteria bacterium Co-bin13]
MPQIPNSPLEALNQKRLFDVRQNAEAIVEGMAAARAKATALGLEFSEDTLFRIGKESVVLQMYEAEDYLDDEESGDSL